MTPRPSPRPPAGRWLAVFLWCALVAVRVLAEPPPTPDPHLEKAKAFAHQLIDAADDDARRRLLAAAPADLRDDATLRRQFNFQIGAFINTGDFARADVLLAFVRRWCEEHGDRLGVALADWGRGNLEGTRGNYRESARHLAVARQFFAESGDRRREASVLSNQSILALQFGDYRQALTDLASALAIHREAKNREAIADTLQTMGNVYSAQGQAERAVEYFQQSLAEAGDNEDTQETLFANLGVERAALGDFPGAVEQMQKALALARKLHDESSESINLSYLARIYAENDRPAEAEKLYRQSLTLAEKVGQKERTAADLSGLAELSVGRHESPDEGSEALVLANRALALARETGDREQTVRACTVRGRLLRRAGKFDEAQAALTEAIDSVEDARGHLTGSDVAAVSFFDSRLEPYQETVALMVDRQRPVEALAYAERARSRVLLDVLSGAHGRFDEALTATERETLRQREDAVTALNREFAAAAPAARAGLAEKLRQARLAREDAEDAAVNAHPELRRIAPSKGGAEPLPAALARLLGGDGGNILLEYSVGTDESFVFLVRPAPEKNAPPAVEVFRLGFGRRTLEERTSAYRQRLAQRGLGWETDARALSKDLLGPVRACLADAARLVIVPDGPLWELPFQTLPLPDGKGGFSVDDTLASRRLSFAPSLGFLTQAREHALPSAAGASPKLLAFGNPSTGRRDAPVNRDVLRDGELSPLPDAEREVQALGPLYGPGNSKILVGPDARETAFRREASSCDVLHFATHGILDGHAPLYSHLVLSQTDLAAGEDGLLEAWEIMRQPLHARLAVLSACETARGRVGAGEGVVGLSWALFVAGCPACVVSQWKVDSAAARPLMVALHKELLAGAPPAEALRRATLALARQPKYQHPFYWAPWVVVGAGD